MPRKRFLGASMLLHGGVFALIVLASQISIHGRPMAQVPPPERPVPIVVLPSPNSTPAPQADSAIAYPHPAPTVRPTPRPTPKPHQRARPHPAKSPSALAKYEKKLPELRREPKTEAEKIAERLAHLGLDPSAAASMDSAVQAAIAAGNSRMYRPTIPVAASSSASAAASGSASPFGLPQAWATASSPLESFLDRILPPDRGYDYQLTYDSTGQPELRIRYRHGNLQTGDDLVFVERWNPDGASSPSVDVQVLTPAGKSLGHFAFTMLQPPGSSLDTFVNAMAGTAMLEWIQGGH